MLTQHELIERGDRARRFLEDAIVREAFDELSTMHLAAIVAAPPGPAGLDAREYHHSLHYALSELGNTIKGYMDVGALARLRMEQDDE